MKTISDCKPVPLTSFCEHPIEHLGTLVLTGKPIEIRRGPAGSLPEDEPFAVVLSISDYQDLLRFRSRIEGFVRHG